MKLTDDKETMKHILRSIDATVVFHNVMMEFCRNELPDDYNDNVTVIDDADRTPVPEERLILDQPLDEDDPPWTTGKQRLHLVKELCIQPDYGGPILANPIALDRFDQTMFLNLTRAQIQVQ